jgi:hypothetical protein
MPHGGYVYSIRRWLSVQETIVLARNAYLHIAPATPIAERSGRSGFRPHHCGQTTGRLPQSIRAPIARPSVRASSPLGDAGESPTLSGPRCASINGFSLHANTPMPAHRRDQVARRIRSTARGAGSLERLAHDAPGDLL